MTAAQAVCPARDRRESKALVVAVSVLQLALIVLVWLLAIVPVALLAVGAMVVQALRPADTKVSGPAPAET
uniref:Uncharacterized protein n=1 Tax=Caulobacter sp. (strain K31) TaxID=366602 RepID=B0SVM3_CAUSK